MTATDATDVVDRRRQLAGIFPGTSVTVLDRDFRFVLAADRALTYVDSTNETHIGLRAPDVLPPKVWTALEPHCHAVLRGESRQLDLAGGPEGTMLHVRAVPMWDKNGDDVERILVLVKDQSDKVSAPAEPDGLGTSAPQPVDDPSRASRVPAQRPMPETSPQRLGSATGL